MRLYEIALSDRERDDAHDRYLTLAALDSTEARVDAAFAATMAALSADRLRELIACRSVEAPGAFVVRNVPVDRDLPPTPTSCSGTTAHSAPVAQAALLGITRLLGEPYGYAREFEGGVITHVLPTRADAGAASSRGAAAPLALHTEDVHLFPFTPDYVALLCVRPDPGGTARTRLADVSEICERLPEDVLAALRIPQFHVRAPRSFGSNAVSFGPIAVVDGPRDNPEIRAELTDMQGLTPQAEHALEVIAGACQSCIEDVTLVAGDILVMNNRKVLHGRTSFQARFDGADRWCMRTLLRSGDLWAWRHYLTGRHVVAL